jgi:hypothetical protein
VEENEPLSVSPVADDTDEIEVVEDPGATVVDAVEEPQADVSLLLVRNGLLSVPPCAVESN